MILISVWAVPLTGLGGEPGNHSKPQPRPRLQLTAEQAVAPVKQPTPTVGIVTLEKMTVTESRVPMTVPRRQEPEPTKFAWQSGGPLAEGKLGGAPLSFGLWAKPDLFAEETQYAEPRAQVEFELVRLKL
jgi:hypothetical protein